MSKMIFRCSLILLALTVLAGCGGSSELEPTAVTEMVTFTFAKKLGSIEEADPIHAAIKEREGIIEAFGDETTITITFDPEILYVNAIVTLMSEMGSPVQYLIPIP